MIRIVVYCNDCGGRGEEGKTHRTARRHSVAKGWRHVGRAADLCPACVALRRKEREAYDAAHPEERGYY